MPLPPIVAFAAKNPKLALAIGNKLENKIDSVLKRKKPKKKVAKKKPIRKTKKK